MKRAPRRCADDPIAKQREIEALFEDGADPLHAAARFARHDVNHPKTRAHASRTRGIGRAAGTARRPDR